MRTGGFGKHCWNPRAYSITEFSGRSEGIGQEQSAGGYQAVEELKELLNPELLSQLEA